MHADVIAKVTDGKPNRLAGVFGALGNRINVTPGFGKDKRPGTIMVVSWEKLEGNQWRLHLQPGMKAALEALDPEWLKPV
jgi:hypothetical protein